MKHKLENVFWLGGSPCAGKSSISEILTKRYNLNLYRVDEAFEIHVRQLDPQLHAALLKWCSATWNERWTQPIETLVQEAILCYREHFTLVLNDVVNLPKNKPLLVEGTALLPGGLNDVLPNLNQTIWVVPTPDFQLKHYAERDWVSGIIRQCDDPESAFRNWMERDIQFARWIKAEAETFGARVLIVDGQQTVEENVLKIAAYFRLETI
jgi:hypothetical protein